MFSEIIKNKYTENSFNSIDWSDFQKNHTNQIDELNQPWIFVIPNDTLNLTVKIIKQPFFFINKNKYNTLFIKAPLIRTCELTNNITQLSDNTLTKKLLEEYINKNFTHVFYIIEQRKSAIINERVMNEIQYWVRGAKIEY
jgi:hypothetical protein